MCRLIAELTNTDVRLLSETIRRLEHRSGSPGLDIRLTADIHAQIHLKIRALGLDPHDTHPKELYVALQNLAAVHENFLKRRFDLPETISATDFAKDVDHIFTRLRFNRRSWLLKPSATRRLMRSNPPKQLMRLLGYRSLDSMVKREPSDVLLFLALQTETDAWQQRLDKQIEKLTSMAFEERLIETRTLDDARYAELSKKLFTAHHTLVLGLPLVGTIFLLPLSGVIKPGMLLLTLVAALKESTELQFAQSYLRYYQMESFFADKLPGALRGRGNQIVTVAGQSFNWHILHRHYGSVGISDHPEVFQPHLHPEDLAYRRAEEVLYKLEPALHFWHGVEYVGLRTSSGIISFNLLDVLINLVNGVPLGSQYNTNLRQSAWDELLIRYMRTTAIERAVLGGLVVSPTHSHVPVRDTEFA